MVDEARSPVGHWHLDKRVPVTMILAILFQAGAFLWWGSALNSRVAVLEAHIIEGKAKAETAAIVERDRSDRLIRVETLMGEVRMTLQEISRKLDAVPRPTHPPAR